MTTIEMIQWFFLMLAADLIATAFVTSMERINWSRVWKKPRKTRRSKKMAQVIPLKKAE